MAEVLTGSGLVAADLRDGTLNLKLPLVTPLPDVSPAAAAAAAAAAASSPDGGLVMSWLLSLRPLPKPHRDAVEVSVDEAPPSLCSLRSRNLNQELLLPLPSEPSEPSRLDRCLPRRSVRLERKKKRMRNKSLENLPSIINGGHEKK